MAAWFVPQEPSASHLAIEIDVLFSQLPIQLSVQGIKHRWFGVFFAGTELFPWCSFLPLWRTGDCIRAPRNIFRPSMRADRNVTLWNTLAQVKQPVAELQYGDRVDVVREEGTSAQIHTATGAVGWLIDSRQLMDADLWQQSATLLARSRTLPVQARGQTKTVSNVRIEPGRNGKRIFQLMRGTPVVVLERTIADATPPADENSQGEKNSSADQQKPKQEDWVLVMRTGDMRPAEPLQVSNAGNPAGNLGSAQNSIPPVSRSSGDPVSSGPLEVQATPGVEDAVAAVPPTPIAGWVLARFVELSLPGPVKDYASSADLRVVAYFELNRVPDGSGGETPQYLVAGSRGGEGQTCDFTMLRVYTWGAVRKRYETAYVEGDLCGRLPIRVSQGANGPEFRFAEYGENAGERTYVMRQTVVRRVKSDSDGKSSSRRSKP